jgi:beta-glucosidase
MQRISQIAAWLMLGLPLISACGSTDPTNTALTPVARNNFWLERHRSINARVEKGNADIVFIGDSITQGWEGAGSDVWDRFYTRRNAVNLGVTGDRTEHVIWRLENGNLKGIEPKVAVIQIGTNNGRSNTPEEIAEGVGRIVSIVQENCANTNIILMSIFPRGRDANSKSRIVNSKVNEIIARLADDETTFFVNISDRYVDDDGVLSTDVFPDLLHPNESGYLIWAEAIDPMLTRLLKDK